MKGPGRTRARRPGRKFYRGRVLGFRISVSRRRPALRVDFLVDDVVDGGLFFGVWLVGNEDPEEKVEDGAAEAEEDQDDKDDPHEGGIDAEVVGQPTIAGRTVKLFWLSKISG